MYFFICLDYFLINSQAVSTDETAGTTLGTVDTEVKTDRLILPAGSSLSNPEWSTLTGAQLTSVGDRMGHKHLRSLVSSVDCHPEKEGMLK